METIQRPNFEFISFTDTTYVMFITIQTFRILCCMYYSKVVHVYILKTYTIILIYIQLFNTIHIYYIIYTQMAHHNFRLYY